jgi:hypothetical protein
VSKGYRSAFLPKEKRDQVRFQCAICSSTEPDAYWAYEAIPQRYAIRLTCSCGVVADIKIPKAALDYASEAPFIFGGA